MAPQSSTRSQQSGGPAQAAQGQPGLQTPDIPDDETQRLEDLLKALEDVRGNPCLVYWTGPQAKMAQSAEVPLYDQLRAISPEKHLDVLLFTSGGDTEAPGRFVSLIREYCESFSLLVPHRCHSAGTLLALGADEIVMTPLGALSPIDPSRRHPLLPTPPGADEPEPISVQDMRHAMQFIREAATDRDSETVRGPDRPMPYDSSAMAEIFSALFDKIHPLAVGAIEQSYALAKLLGRKCLATHMDAEEEAEEIEHLVDTLCDEYKSHSYQIGRAEAKDLGLKVSKASDEEEEAMMDLVKFYRARASRPSNVSPGNTLQMFIAWMDSREMKMRVEGIYQVTAQGEVQHAGDNWERYDQSPDGDSDDDTSSDTATAEEAVEEEEDPSSEETGD